MEGPEAGAVGRCPSLRCFEPVLVDTARRAHHYRFFCTVASVLHRTGPATSELVSHSLAQPVFLNFLAAQIRSQLHGGKPLSWGGHRLALAASRILCELCVRLV
mmetsp:Transcript_99665/g.319813  ORF Transcript_99665/g.319813 Transcript_99665/m.319813 type:complete len:104 (-) Transcript_99665:158-469(-)